uniref:Integrase catalytic domain-containing protein n=1 Tax=Daphnia galeata TaxID=27404 RepID=A0A8J2RDB5_9CRUS|nr:unnamed protein product [Daphnia galeata]
MSISDIGPILWMSFGEPRNIPTAETEIQWMSFFKFLSALASATGCSTNNRNKHIPDKISTEWFAIEGGTTRGNAWDDVSFASGYGPRVYVMANAIVTNSFKDVSHLAKFNVQNFTEWKYEFQSMMEQLGLKALLEAPPGGVLEVIPIEIRVENAITNQANIDAWRMRDITCRNYILATTDQSQKILLYPCTTAREMWVKLTSQHAARADDTIHQRWQELYDYKYDSEKNVTSYINGILSIAYQLREMNEPVPERQILNKILAALPPTFRMVRSAWTVVPTSTAFRAHNSSNQRPRGGHQAGKGGYPGLRGHKFDARRGTPYSNNTGYHHNQRERPKSNQEFECALCERDTHKTEDCRKLAKAREILKRGKGSNMKNQDSAFPASTSKDQDSATSDHELYEEETSPASSSRKDSAFPAAACYAARSILDWFADSGATQHMKNQKALLKNYKPISPGSWTVSGIGETSLDVYGVGDAEVTVNVNGEDRVIIIHKILHVPRLGTNLFSIGTATENGMEAVFIDNQVFFFRNGKVEITGKRARRTLYHLNIRSHINERDAAYSATKGTSMAVWHQRLAHVNTKTIRRMFTQGIVDGLDLHQTPEEKSSPCWGCAEGKMHRTSFKEGRNRATRLGELIHSDVCGPMSTPTLAGSNYYVTFKDDFSGWVVVNFMKKKSEVPQLFRQFAATVRNKTNYNVLTLRSDNGGEYSSNEFITWLLEMDIQHEKSVPYTPEQNGVAERENRTLMEAARCMLHGSKQPLFLWGEAVAYATYILNRKFGSKVFVHILDGKRSKLDPKAVEGVLVGHCEHTKGYRIYIPEQRKCHGKIKRREAWRRSRILKNAPLVTPLRDPKEPGVEDQPVVAMEMGDHNHIENEQALKTLCSALMQLSVKNKSGRQTERN